MTDVIETLNCPWCEGDTIAMWEVELDEFVVCCVNVDCPVLPQSAGYSTRKRAVEAWNSMKLFEEYAMAETEAEYHEMRERGKWPTQLAFEESIRAAIAKDILEEAKDHYGCTCDSGDYAAGGCPNCIWVTYTEDIIKIVNRLGSEATPNKLFQ